MSESQIAEDEHGNFSSESIESEVPFHYDTEPTGYGDPSMEIPRQVPEVVKIPEASAQAYSAGTFCYRICKPKAGYYHEATAIRKYRKLLQKEYDAVFLLMDWLELPGNEHEKVKGHNYLSCQLWMYSFAAVNIEEEDKQKEHLVDKHYEDTIIAAEETGMTLRQFLKPLGTITEACKLLEKMSNLIDPRMHVPGIKNINTKPRDEVIQKTVLRGNRIDDFTKLHIYSRDLSKIQWTEFHALSLQSQLSQLTTGLDQFIGKVRQIHMLLERPLVMLNKADSKLFSGGLKLVPHIKRMYTYLKKIMTSEELNQSDEQIIKDLFIEINTHVLYVVQTGRNLVTKVWEIVLMTRLCYIYVKESSNSHVSLVAYDVIMNRKFKKDVKRLLKPSEYDHEDFFLASCPDVLRKVPIVINRKLELALHYEGHRNVVKSGKQSPSMSYVRRKSLAQSSSNENSHLLQVMRQHGMIGQNQHSSSSRRSMSRRKSSVKIN